MRSSEEVGTEGAGDDPKAPRQDETPLKSILMVDQTVVIYVKVMSDRKERKEDFK